MPANTEYIESYFQQTLSSEERAAFEKRCETDNAFAGDVAIYFATRQVLHETLLEQKSAEWKATKEVEKEPAAPVISLYKKPGFRKWLMYAAAACLLLAAAMFLFERSNSPRTLAANYIKENNNLSLTMDGSRDSLQTGMDAYNTKDYNKALVYFKGVQQNDPTNADAKKYAGFTYLQQENYDKAYEEFDNLSKMQLHSNPGDFLKAVALLQRNQANDKENAKLLLNKVVNEKEEESEKAEEWLNKF